MTTRQSLLIVLTAATALVSAGAGAPRVTGQPSRENMPRDNSPSLQAPRSRQFRFHRYPWLAFAVSPTERFVIVNDSIHNPAAGDSQVSLNCFVGKATRPSLEGSPRDQATPQLSVSQSHSPSRTALTPSASS